MYMSGSNVHVQCERVQHITGHGNVSLLQANQSTHLVEGAKFIDEAHNFNEQVVEEGKTLHTECEKEGR